jgi:hypothetical protein
LVTHGDYRVRLHPNPLGFVICDQRFSRRKAGEESAMVRHAGHFDGIDAVIRANRTLLLGLLWGALFGCVAVASVYDVGRWFGAW